MNDLTVILPSAGKGTRLSLDFSKELLTTTDRCLIDYSFDLFNEIPINNLHFIVIINENKTDIVKYLSRYKNKYNISFIFQKDKFLECTGAILSAEHILGEKNLVLLPDTYIKLLDKKPLYTQIIEQFNKTDFFFIYKKETNEEILKTKGALKIVDNHVKDYIDKPIIKLNEFNAYWGGYGFAKNLFNQVVNHIHNSTLKLSNVNFELTPMYNSTGIEIEDYIDLGSWPEYHRFISLNQ